MIGWSICPGGGVRGKRDAMGSDKDLYVYGPPITGEAPTKKGRARKNLANSFSTRADQKKKNGMIERKTREA